MIRILKTLFLEEETPAVISAFIVLGALAYALSMDPMMDPNNYSVASDAIVYMYKHGAPFYFDDYYLTTGHIGF